MNTQYTLTKAFRFLSFLTILLYGLLIPVLSQNRTTETFSEKYGTHYIVLVDGSGDNGGNAENIQRYVPELIFSASVGNRPVPDMIKFRPGKDKISVASFTIFKDTSPCREDRKYSALPEHMFKYEPNRVFEKAADLAGYLSRTPCSYEGSASPITTATNLILPFLQTRLKDASLYSQTYVIVASNNQFNGNLTTPSEELNTLSGDLKVTDTEQAGVIADNFNRLYRKDTKIEKINGLSLNISKISAAGMDILHAPKIALDRAAMSRDEIRLAPARLGGDELQIYLKRDDRGYNLDPKFLEISFRDENGAPLRIGEKTLSETYRYDLSACEPPKCVRTETQMNIPLLAMVGGDLKFTKDEFKPAKGKLHFSVGLNYRTSLFDRLSEEVSGIIPLEPSAKKIPGFIFGESEITNGDLLQHWNSDTDQAGLLSEEVANRIFTQRRYNFILLIGLAAIASIITLLLLYRKYYHRKFNPGLKWFPSERIVVDFGNPMPSRILVGQLKVINHGAVPWLGKRLGEESQPSATARLNLSYPPLIESGIETNGQAPIGFIKPQNENDPEEKTLSFQIKKPVTHEDLVFIFLDREALKDFSGAGAVIDAVSLPLRLDVEMVWQSPVESEQKSSRLRFFSNWWKNFKRDRHTLELSATLTLVPEKSRKPVVEFVAETDSADDKLYFSGRDGKIRIGKFIYRSQAASRFAQPFSGTYNIVGFRENIDLGTEIIVPESPTVTVPPRTEVEVPVFIVCDGERVLNPAPIFHDYAFSLLGEFDPNGSKPGPHLFKLFRDREKAEIELLITSHTGETFEVFWENDSPARSRRRNGEETLLLDDQLILSEKEVKFDPGSRYPQYLFKIDIGNSAKFGNGAVSVSMTARAEVDPVMAAIRLWGKAGYDDLFGIMLPDKGGFQSEPEKILIREGEAAEAREIKFTPEWIETINGARVPSDKFGARVGLDITIETDSKTVIRRHLDVRIPIFLEQLPGRNWLCIDFGTSAIAVAHGSSGKIYSLPLQEITKNGDPDLAFYDSENTERGNPKLIPSQIILDADVRIKDPRISRLGFPHSPPRPESFVLGNPNFIGLPAHSDDSKNLPDRIIYSLKSWLGRSARRIRLPGNTRIKFVDETGKEFFEDSVPLNAVVESAFAALYEAYLFDPEYQAGQLVITHPNSFTDIHKQRLHDIVYKSLGSKFRIPFKERISMISESDAVAYNYCNQRRLQGLAAGREEILIYDFGAGTLDLSLIEVAWKKSGSNVPEEWIVRARLGIPVAGNHIDQILARLIDKYLRSEELSKRYEYQYQYEIVSKTSGEKLKDPDYRWEIINLWKEIRKSKHDWDGRGPLEIKVGETREFGIVRDTKIEKIPDFFDSTAVSLVERNGSIYLSIPAREVHEYSLMREFINFVTEDLLAEILTAGGVSANAVKAVIVSGRGALWPGLQEKVQTSFPNADYSDFKDMKQVVAEGAIAWQALGIKPSNQASLNMKLGALIDNGKTLMLIEDDYKELDLEADTHFRIVQVGLRNPQPMTDMGTLRENFYNDLFQEINRFELGWRENERFFVKKELADGRLRIWFKGEHTENFVDLYEQIQVSEQEVAVPWPSGHNFLLPPED